ncbi:MAG: AzlC family ABC transporter permease [Clostridiales Family XIII bacterium]|nr:AzlC family ABC transporter permease [Clostridiales Family XIII bacterium]
MTGNKTFWGGIQSCLPTVLGYIGIGLALGIVGINSNLTLWEIALTSIFIYAGSAQFIFCGLFLLHAPIPLLVSTIFLVNLRHLLMSMSASQSFLDGSFRANVGIGLLLTDESFAVLMTEVARGQKITIRWMNGLNIMAYLTWILATIVGGLIGRWIPNPYAFGLDYALAAMFAGLFIAQASLSISAKGKSILFVLSTVFVSLYLFMYIVSPEIAILIATLLGCTVGVMIHGHK